MYTCELCQRPAVRPHACACGHGLACAACAARRACKHCGRDALWFLDRVRHDVMVRDPRYLPADRQALAREEKVAVTMDGLVHAFLDFEATDKTPMDCRIVQIGCVAVAPHLKEPATYDAKVKADKPMTPQAAEITGITDASLARCLPCKPALCRFLAWLDGVRRGKPVVLVAHNGLNYDFPLLCCELHRSHLAPFPTLKKHGVVLLFDSLKWMRVHVAGHRCLRRKDGSPSYRLVDMHEALFDEPLQDAHDALADCRSMHRQCVELKADFTRDDGHICCTAQAYCEELQPKLVSIARAQRQRANGAVAGQKRSLLDMFRVATAAQRPRVAPRPAKRAKRATVAGAAGAAGATCPVQRATVAGEAGEAVATGPVQQV